MAALTQVATSFDRIVIPTDFSDVSQRALEYAKSIAKRYDSRLFLLHVTEPIKQVRSCVRRAFGLKHLL
jgi:nucleotide-binding universal stress UspA family protein